MNKMRFKTRDAAFKYRMGAGYPGDVTRTHPVDIFPELADATTPPDLAGQGVILDATSHRVRKLIVATDGVTGSIALYGITVRTFPFQAILCPSCEMDKLFLIGIVSHWRQLQSPYAKACFCSMPRATEVSSLDEYDVYHSGYEENEFNIEWMRYGSKCKLPDIVKKLPHVAFEVDDIYKSHKGT